MKTPLQYAQACFVEWLNELDAVLLDAQREHEKAVAGLNAGDSMAFATALGVMAGKVDQARNEIANGLEQGFDE